MASSSLVAAPTTVPSLELNLPPVETKPWRFKEFPILGWWGPPGTASVDAFRDYKAAGFTLYCANSDVGYHDALAKAREAGIAVMTFRDKQGFELDAPQTPIDFEEADPNIVGWITYDEPHHARVVPAITAVNDLMRRDPDRRALFNFLPPKAQTDRPTEEILDAAVQYGLPIISYDAYYLAADGHDNEAGQCKYLDRFRLASLKYDRPFWAFALSIQHGGLRRASESDLRWMVYTTLAYGAKGIWYFTYWAPAHMKGYDTRAIVTKDGERTDLFDSVSAVNHAIGEVGETLLKLKNVEVFHTDPPAGQRPLPADGFAITRCEAKGAIVSFFVDPDGIRYAWLVNKTHGPAVSAKAGTDTITLTFAEGVRGVTAVSHLGGKTGELAIDAHRATLNVAGGTGVLLRFTP